MNTNALNGDHEYPKSAGGRPTVKTPETRKKVLDAIRKGAPRSVAAKVARISPQTLSAWVAEDPDLAAEIDQAESEVTARMVERLTGFAEAGDVSALRYWLEVREPTLSGSSRKGFASLP